MELIMDAIRAIRARRSEMNVPPSRKAALTIVTAQVPVFLSGIPFFQRLAGASDVTITSALGGETRPEGMVEVITHAARIFMPLSELVDLAQERARIAKEREKAEKGLAIIEKKLSNESFVAKAPEAVVNAEREKAEKLRALIAQLEASAAAIQAGDTVRVDFASGVITDETQGKTWQAAPFPEFVDRIIEAGGLLNSLKARGVAK